MTFVIVIHKPYKVLLIQSVKKERYNDELRMRYAIRIITNNVIWEKEFILHEIVMW